MTHFWANDQPITVATARGGIPDRFTWRGQRHTVRHITNAWRIDEGWWQEHIWRDYYKLITTTGLFVIIYHNLRTGTWFMHRVYD
jgi:hypothetical protein